VRVPDRQECRIDLGRTKCQSSCGARSAFKAMTPRAHNLQVSQMA